MTPMSAKRALVVFARVPEPGRVKTRLTTLLSADEAARLYESFLFDALDGYRTLDAAVRLYLAPSESRVPAGFGGEDAAVFLQKGSDLGSRLLGAFVETFAAGFEQVVAIGTDHPTLPPAFVELAFEQLDAPLSVCIGPTEDGGYYLLGANEFYPGLFPGIPYGTDGVFEQTMARIDETGAGVTVLPRWYDVDTPDDLARLWAELAGAPERAPRTAAYLATLAEGYPALRGAANSR